MMKPGNYEISECEPRSGFKKKSPNYVDGFLVGDDPDLSGELPTHITFKNKKKLSEI